MQEFPHGCELRQVLQQARPGRVIERSFAGRSSGTAAGVNDTAAPVDGPAGAACFRSYPWRAPISEHKGSVHAPSVQLAS